MKTLHRIRKAFSCLFLLLPMSSGASLIGDDVLITRLTDGEQSGDGICCGPFWVTVEAGTGDKTSLSYGDNLFVDVEANSILIDFGPNGGSGGDGDRVIVIDDLDWAGEPSRIITGYSVDTDLSGFSGGEIAFIDHRVEIQIGSLMWSGGQFLDIGLETSIIPIPAAIYLFGSGLLGLAGIARFKKAV
jgi:hypothetical protein